MSLCENPETCPRREAGINCPLGKASEVIKIVNRLEIEGTIRWLAGEIWMGRGGGLSSVYEEKKDYHDAIKVKIIEVCKGI
jgi:hypothetical protein